MDTSPEESYQPQTVLLCDDDMMVRSVIGQMLRELDLEVVAESEDPETAMEDALRLHPDVVILDLALRGGQGENLLARLRRDLPSARVVIFSSYVANPMHLIDAGASGVVDKPDFERLEEVLRTLSESPDRVLRRSPPHEIRPTEAPLALSLSGLEPWETFESSLETLVPGDAILVFDVIPTGTLGGVWDAVFDADYRLAVARAAVRTARVQDRVSLHPTTGLPVMQIIAGHVEAPMVVFERISEQWDREIASGLPVGAFAHVSIDRTGNAVLSDALARVIGRGFGVDTPLAIA